ncbi:MAG: hypothetical protein IJR90_02920 [Clostridia bacterium]|nr:hypothetical protein [Clostridia bacterium]
MTVNEAIGLLGLETLNLSDGDRPIEGGYTGDLLSWVMGRAQSGDAWVTIMTNINVVAVAQLTDVACVIIAEGAEIGGDVIARAASQGINLLRGGKTAWEMISALSDKI